MEGPVYVEYTGSEINLMDLFDLDQKILTYCDIEGTVSATDIGQYSVTFTINKPNICWDNWAIKPITINWEICQSNN